jgi:hypothetical protein
MDNSTIDYAEGYEPNDTIYSGLSFGDAFKGRDASYEAATFAALRLAGITSGVVDDIDNAESFDENEAVIPAKPIPNVGQFLEVKYAPDDPFFVAWKDGERVAAWYFTFRGSYHGFLVTKDKRLFWTNDAAHPDGEWEPISDSVMRESLEQELA